MEQMRRPLIITGIVVVLVVVALIFANVMAKNSVQKKAQTAIESVPGVALEESNIKAKGFVFLGQALTGKVDQVSFNAKSVTYQIEQYPFVLQNVTSEIKGLTVSEPYVADQATGSFFISQQTLANLLTVKGIGMEIACQQGKIMLSTDINKVPIQLEMTVSPITTKSADLSREIPALEFRASNLSIDISSLGSSQQEQNANDNNANQNSDSNNKNNSSNNKNTKSNSDRTQQRDTKANSLASIFQNFNAPSFVVPLEQAPEGLTISGLNLVEGGIEVTFEGTGLNLSQIQAAASQMPAPPAEVSGQNEPANEN